MLCIIKCIQLTLFAASLVAKLCSKQKHRRVNPGFIKVWGLFLQSVVSSTFGKQLFKPHPSLDFVLWRKTLWTHVKQNVFKWLDQLLFLSRGFQSVRKGLILEPLSIYINNLWDFSSKACITFVLMTPLLIPMLFSNSSES